MSTPAVLEAQSLARKVRELAQWLAANPHPSSALNNLARQADQQAQALLQRSDPPSD